MRFSGENDQVRNRTGWYVTVPPERGHYCYPPKAFPFEVGAGAPWRCVARGCGAIWQPEGVQVVGDSYPVALDRNDGLLGPGRWTLRTASAHPAFVDGQEGLYDWRPVAPYYVKLYRRMIELLGGEWKDL